MIFDSLIVFRSRGRAIARMNEINRGVLGGACICNRTLKMKSAGDYTWTDGGMNRPELPVRLVEDLGEE